MMRFHFLLVLAAELLMSAAAVRAVHAHPGDHAHRHLSKEVYVRLCDGEVRTVRAERSRRVLKQACGKGCRQTHRLVRRPTGGKRA